MSKSCEYRKEPGPGCAWLEDGELAKCKEVVSSTAAVTSYSGIEIIRKGCRVAGKEARPPLCGSKTVQS